MAPTIRKSMPANDLDLQRYVAPGDVATINAMDAKAIEHQNSFQPSLAQDSDKNANNKWLKDLALNPSHIEIQPTTLASLEARDLEPDNEPNGINCNSFGIRGGRRCKLLVMTSKAASVRITASDKTPGRTRSKTSPNSRAVSATTKASSLILAKTTSQAEGAAKSSHRATETSTRKPSQHLA